jgi:hypothetical protein
MIGRLVNKSRNLRTHHQCRFTCLHQGIPQKQRWYNNILFNARTRAHGPPLQPNMTRKICGVNCFRSVKSKDRHIAWFTSERATFESRTPAQQHRVIFQQHASQKTYTEGDIQIAIYDIDSKQFKSGRCAAAIYNVPQTTVQHQRAGQRS